MQNPTAQPANIQAFRLSEDEAQVVYSSRRGLCTLAHGIIEVIADFYGEDISIREVTCTKKGHPYCTFEAKRVTADNAPSEVEAVSMESIATAESLGDSFSLGCVACEISSGRRAFESDSTKAIISSMQRLEPKDSD
jgi:hypothetical protein